VFLNINTMTFAARDFWRRRGASDKNTLGGLAKRQQPMPGGTLSPTSLIISSALPFQWLARTRRKVAEGRPGHSSFAPREGKSGRQQPMPGGTLSPTSLIISSALAFERLARTWRKVEKVGPVILRPHLAKKKSGTLRRASLPVMAGPAGAASKQFFFTMRSWFNMPHRA
jgi:hypothetical protein